MGGTRKLAAILVADIVGYSRLAGTDEDRTLSSPEPAADWEIRVAGWLGAPPEATPLGPSIGKIPSKLIQCFYGSRDTGSYCRGRRTSSGSLPNER